ncbi:PqqD family protein [Alkalibacterium sp. f15]|uniref:PqqD family protein n=1 Tax=Alkalibacterium sp. f15 TaxID=3414029 RepID=UPI003BF7F006
MIYKLDENIKLVDIKEKLFVYNISNGDCFGIEGVGLEIIQGIEEEKNIEVIIENIFSNYDVTKEQATHDVKNYIRQLLKNNLIIK